MGSGSAHHDANKRRAWPWADFRRADLGSAIAKQYKLSPQRRGKPFIGRSTLAARIDERERAREGAAWRVVRYTTARDDAPCINGDGSSSCSFEFVVDPPGHYLIFIPHIIPSIHSTSLVQV